MTTQNFGLNHGLPVIIIGAGFAGLTVAQGLHKHGIPFLVFEQDELSHRPGGHRFRIDTDGPEALYETIPTELDDLFTRTCPRLINRSPTFADSETLELLDFPKRPPKPGRGPSAIDRAWILQLLSLGIENRIHRGRKLSSYDLGSDEVTAVFTDGTSVKGRLLVGADGIHSKVRHQLQPERRLVDTERQIVWARMWITPEFLAAYPEEAFTWFVGIDKQHPERNVILEPITWTTSVAQESQGRLPDGKDYVYWSLTTETFDQPLRSPEELRTFVLDKTQKWDLNFRSLFEHADWSLAVRARLYSSKPGIGDFSLGDGRLVLIGDAAHPMTPQGGLGGNTAVKGAAELCRTIVEEGVSKESMAGFEERIRELAREAIELSFKTAKFMVKGKDWEEYHEVEEGHVWKA
ncbi:hypothetical protein PRZ48_011288 [Zasmidium cellare]|uniref:FAD-binding domain-containing protein n=1 Tax=Zasmidium cellare TaxID=395010 RepID=A0ABR0E604_ZASCE|nr:hypothetical protein PRZ48_011288 [Zasmidium cellare]